MIAMVHTSISEEGAPNECSTAPGKSPLFSHVPVLLDAVVKALSPSEGKCFVDGTLGGGGHSKALLDAGATVVGIDQDPAALAYASQRLAGYGSRFHAVHASFGDVASVLDDLRIRHVHGALLDLGVSSHQLDTPERGFSFQAEGPLDMRMNPRGPVTARDLVNTASQEQLERIIREFGEEPHARRIAARLTRDRAVRPLDTTLDLVRSVESVVPRRGKNHPATRVFQALRIAVNRELEVLSRGLTALSQRLYPGGRLAIITFHSLEDRMVKQFFQRHSVPTVDRPEWSAPRANPDCIFKKQTAKPITASETELRSNPRSRSAKLRVVERLPHRTLAVSPRTDSDP
jgi:16S rRNA (cytosine1402-N4)-methyltransferase